MARFADAEGRVWTLRLAVRDLPRVRRLTGRDLGELLWGSGRTLADDPDAFCALVWVAARAGRAGVAEPDLADALTPAVMVAAAAALRAAVDDFLPDPEPADPADDGAVPDLDRLAWELAGVAGVDPRPLTLRRLARMARGRERAEWTRAASLMLAHQKTMTGKPEAVTSLDQLLPRWMRAEEPAKRRGPPTDRESEMGFRLLGQFLGQVQRDRGR